MTVNGESAHNQNEVNLHHIIEIPFRKEMKLTIKVLFCAAEIPEYF